MCIDYRLLNKNTKLDRFPLPRIDDMLDTLAQARYFTKIYLANAYHQVEMTSEDQHKTAFQTNSGLYEYIVMPFGLCNAPSTFQRLMHHVFAEDLDKPIMVYLDDILVYSDSEDEHVQEVRKYLEKLRQHQLFSKREKCEFGIQKVEYLGHFAENGCLKADTRKVATVTE